jgi:hypothetical protein
MIYPPVYRDPTDRYCQDLVMDGVLAQESHYEQSMDLQAVVFDGDEGRQTQLDAHIAAVAAEFGLVPSGTRGQWIFAPVSS